MYIFLHMLCIVCFNMNAAMTINQNTLIKEITSDNA